MQYNVHGKSLTFTLDIALTEHKRMIVNRQVSMCVLLVTWTPTCTLLLCAQKTQGNQLPLGEGTFTGTIVGFFLNM